MGAVFIQEWKLFIKNIKNIAIFFILIIGAIYYTAVIAPSYVHPETIDEQAIEREIEELYTKIDNIKDDFVRSLPLKPTYYEMIELDKNRLEALETEDYRTYAKQTMDWFGYSSIKPTRRYRDYGDWYPEQTTMYKLANESRRYQGYLDKQLKITPALLHEQTALQVFKRSMEGMLPIVFLVMVIFYSNDILTNDRKHMSLVDAYPVSLNKRLWAKTAVAVTASMLTIILAFGVGVLITGQRFGFGSLKISVPYYYVKELFDWNIDIMSMSMYVLKSMTMFFLLALIFTRGILLLSILFRNEFVNLLAIAAIFAESLYYGRGSGPYTKKPWYPSTYFKVGEVLNGHRNFLYTTDVINFQNSLLSLGALFLLIECLMFLVTRIRYFRKVA